MNRFRLLVVAILLTLPVCRASTTYYVNVANSSPVSPFTSWATAATNIQDAIDVSAAGDLVLVTDGVYSAGSWAILGNGSSSGAGTNRVTINKAITVQSVNGPWTTKILGGFNIRCAWVTNNSVLSGFTLQGGSTGISQDGAGAWCASSNVTIANCLIISNSAGEYGGGVYGGTVKNCYLTGNGAGPSGAAAYGTFLNNCTVISNNLRGGVAVSQGGARNCIIYFNAGGNFGYYDTNFSYCCTTPALAGTGDFTNNPQLFADGIHLTNASPCIGTGDPAAAGGTDIFGNPWNNYPSIGCAEFSPAPLVKAPRIQFFRQPPGFGVSAPPVIGQVPISCWWLKDGSPLVDSSHLSGTQTTNLLGAGLSPDDNGRYQLVASNAFGVVTGAVAQVTIHCVDAGGTHPVAPYLTWDTAATNLQDAVDAAGAGEIVLVTNGVYESGGRSMDGIITNRVSLNKALVLQSVNGPYATFIEGNWGTNDASAVRGVWMTNGSVLNGFTIRGGATRSGSGNSCNGGGIWGTSTNAVVNHCILAYNLAGNLGGGAYNLSLNHCTLLNNKATGAYGGGAASCNLQNCLVANNYASLEGGGGYNCTLTNCAVIKNSASSGGAVYAGRAVNCTITANTSYFGAVENATLLNSIVYGNTAAPSNAQNYSSCTFSYSDSDPLPSGTGNIDADPQFLGDGIHLSSTSPCLGAGNSAVVTGSDIDDQSWNTPPVIGCDDWHADAVLGLSPSFQPYLPAGGITFQTLAVGQGPFGYSWRKDGAPISDDGHFFNSATPNLALNSLAPEDSGIYQLVITNSAGSVTGTVTALTIHTVDAAGAAPVAPFSSWATAATNIQDAVDAASAGDIVLVNPGDYRFGGKFISGTSNRVALDKAVTLVSVDGYTNTTIEGAWDPATIMGPAAARCVYLSDGASIYGFTLKNGATLNSSIAGSIIDSGGGVFCISTNALVSNCLLLANYSAYGGGICNGTLNNSWVTANSANFGGGAYGSVLNNCTLLQNFIRYNPTPYYTGGSGTYNCSVRNSIVFYNLVAVSSNSFMLANNYIAGSFTCSCADPLPSGAGNIDAAPQFIDGFHISTASPCIGAGSPAYANGSDLDGESWGNPPSMGCDEIVSSNLVGPLAVSIRAFQTDWVATRSDQFWGAIAGRASGTEWFFGDGSTSTNPGVSVVHTWTNSGDYTVTFTAYNNDHPAGVSTNLIIHVAPFPAAQLQSAVWTNGGFKLQFLGTTNPNYSVQYSVQYTTNLASPAIWTTLGGPIFYTYSTNNVVQFFNSSTDTARFYRVLAQ